MLIDDIFETDIKSKLDELVGVSVLDGFLVHYADDLQHGNNGVGFPCVAVQLKSQDSAFTAGAIKSVYGYSLIGAVDALDFQTVNSRVAKLLLDVRTKLYSDFYTGETKATKIELGSATITLPDASEVYALFELSLTIELVEKR